MRTRYDRIRMDIRHRHVTDVWTSSATERRFPSWTMGFEDLEQHGSPGPGSGGLSDPEQSGASSHPSLDGSAGTAEQRDFDERRRAALRRALASGDRRVVALGIILNGHEPEALRDVDGTGSPRCRECRSRSAPVLDACPCPTAKNALRGFEATDAH